MIMKKFFECQIQATQNTQSQLNYEHLVKTFNWKTTNHCFLNADESKHPHALFQQISMFLSIGDQIFETANIELDYFWLKIIPELHQFAELLENLIKTLQDKFEESRTVLLKVLAKQRMTKQKEEEQIRLRVQQRRFQQQIRLELKEDYEQQRDKIIQNARAELLQERQKWLKQRAELLRIHGEQSAGSPARSNGYKEDIELQLKIVRELQAYNESTISELKIRIKQLEEELKKKE